MYRRNNASPYILRLRYLLSVVYFFHVIFRLRHISFILLYFAC